MIGGELGYTVGFTVNKALSYGDIVFNLKNYTPSDVSYFFNGELAVVQVNQLYYGLYNSHRYFDSYIIEWVGFGSGVMVIFNSLFSSDNDDDEIVK